MPKISIRYLLVITIVFAALATAAGYWLRITQGQTEWMPWFIASTAMAPLALMTAIYWSLRLSKVFVK